MWQPWASAIAWGLKTWETRSWRIAPGPLAIHAGALRSSRDNRDFYYEVVCPYLRGAGLPVPGWGALPFGAVVATCRVLSCEPAPVALRQIDPGAPDRELGDYSVGRWAWRLGDLRALDPPQAARGHQGLWDWR